MAKAKSKVSEITVQVRVKFNASLWDSLKMRISGIGEFIKDNSKEDLLEVEAEKLENGQS